MKDLEEMKTKTIKIGDGVGVLLPKELGFHTGESVTVGKVDNGTIIIKRNDKETNPWKTDEFAGIDFSKQVDQIGFNIGFEKHVGNEE